MSRCQTYGNWYDFDVAKYGEKEARLMRIERDASTNQTYLREQLGSAIERIEQLEHQIDRLKIRLEKL